MTTLPYSWQECRLCGGAYLLWADPGAALDTDETGLGERWTEWMHLDGRPYDEADSAACNTCESLDFESMTSPQRRWGLSLPGVTQAAMRSRGLPVLAGAGFRVVAQAPSRGTVVPADVARPAASAPGTPRHPGTYAPGPTPRGTPDGAVAEAGPGGPPPSRAVPFLVSLVRSIAAAPRSSVETYAPREPLELSDPLVWIVMGASAVTLVAVVVGWFTSPGNVPQ